MKKILIKKVVVEYRAEIETELTEAELLLEFEDSNLEVDWKEIDGTNSEEIVEISEVSEIKYL